MAKKPHVLFLFFEGLAETVIDSQVLSHIRSIADAGIATFEIACAPWQQDVFELSVCRRADAEERAGCKIHIVEGVRPSHIGSASENAARILRVLAPSPARFTHIHARTDYSAVAGSQLKKSIGAILIWDCRGDAAAELDYRADLQTGLASLSVPALRMALTRRMRNAAHLCDRALFVSHPLHALVAGEIAGKPFAIVPSCASEAIFFYDPALRAAVRRELGIKDGTTVIVYSGGLQAYQRFDDCVDAFEEFRADTTAALFLVASPQAAKVSELLASKFGAESWIARKATLREVNGLLNAADAAFLLRDDTPTNHSASPTKFAEYCLAGLRVIMSNAVKDSHRLAVEFGNLIDFDEETGHFSITNSTIAREEIAARARRALAKGVHLDAYRTIYAP